MIQRAVGRHTVRRDPWERVACTVPLSAYGLGARRGFPWYFEGQSRVSVGSVDDVLAWLASCHYVRDETLFFEPDFWQHPCTLEHLGKGDCEDFALWAWRKLAELGEHAEFVAGRCRVLPSSRSGNLGNGHAWVHLRRNDDMLLLDPTMSTSAAMLRPLSAVRDDYLPEVSVDTTFTRYAYLGYLQRG
jgi:hypothetical protein